MIDKRKIAKFVTGVGIFIGTEVIVRGIVQTTCPKIKPVLKPCVWLAELALVGAIADKANDYAWDEIVDPTIDIFQTVLNIAIEE